MKAISGDILIVILGTLIIAFVIGCSQPMTTRGKGAAIGALGGAGLGAIIGSATGSAGAGEVILADLVNVLL
ncbi:MAG: hypothetical protein ACREQ7_04710 [Candidatus Binatia bacterium]